MRQRTPASDERKLKRSNQKRLPVGLLHEPHQMPGTDVIPDDDIRLLVRRTTGRIGVERFVRMVSESRAALMSGDIARARRAAGTCHFPPCRDLMRRLLQLANSGDRVEAVNSLLRAGLFAYENSLDHLRAYLEYERDLGRG